MPDARLETLADELHASGNYRVLRRLVPRATINPPDGSELRLGIVLDTETTGLDTAKDEIIELAMVPFTYSPDGRIFQVQQPFHGLRQPSIPISAEITAITGLDDEAVRGHAIDPDEVAAFAEPATIIIAHHAAFDRPFIDRFCPALQRKCWGCSMEEIDWRAEGYETKRLASLVAEAGYFYDRHVAVHDCLALIELLARPLPKSGRLGLAALIETARQPTWRLWAEDSPFHAKDVLRSRGYRWNNGEDGRPKSWFFDARSTKARETEIAFLRSEIYSALPQKLGTEFEFRVDKITAFERFAAGVG